MKSKENGLSGKLCFWAFLAVGGWCLIAGVSALFWNGPLTENLWQGNGWKVILETTFFFVWMLFFCCLPMAAHVRLGGISLGMLGGIWCHQVFLPFVISGLWLLGILMLGDGIRRAVSRKALGWQTADRNRDPAEGGKLVWQQRLSADFVTGAGAWISLICILSAFRIGGLSRIRLIAAAVFLIMAAGHGIGGVLERRKAEKKLPDATRCRWRILRSRILFYQEGILLAVILTMVFIQLARINLWPDYDSLHYGLRSPYILDNGHGIYEDLGNINLVYTYPKGFEILTFPLAGTATFGYVLCFNVWMTLLVLILTYGLARQLGASSKLGLLAASFVSLIPGVMNMAITAKSDTITLVCQLVILNSAAGILTDQQRRNRRRWIGIAAGGCFLSYSMKPTAVVFSTVISLVCLVFLVGNGGFAETGREDKERGSLLFPAGAWAGTWIRTYRMTGVPTTSVFTSIWEHFGFQVRWPYAFSAIPDQGLEMGPAESARFLLKRVYRILIAPTGEDMAHVIIAWGTSLMALCLAAWILWGRKALRRNRGTGQGKAYACIHVTAVFVGLFSLFSIYLLWQVDGNYFMLMYVLLAVIGAFCMEEGIAFHGRKLTVMEPGAAARLESRAAGTAAVLLAWGFLLFHSGVTLCTNWAGSTGFTPVKLKNPGYYHHQQALYQQKCSQGNQAIWSILSQDPTARVIAVGEHPQVLQFPCNVQSYYDVTGSGGNVRLVKTLENFKEFLRFAGTDYLYVQAGFLEEGTRCYDVVRYLVEDGSLADIRYENGNMIAVVDLDRTYQTDPEREAAEFYQNIRLKSGGGL
ncbi:MAG: hypothetical protein Q4E86_03535 [Lachnospiraceae bacterium]|nr:hypothetical protein [Lachnospiraceae bacterium]